mgnify:FL=1
MKRKSFQDSTNLGIFGRDPVLTEEDEKLTKKIAEEAAWWKTAAYMDEPIDWSNRVRPEPQPSPKPAVPAELEQKLSPFSRETDFFKKVVRYLDMVIFYD